MHLLLCTTSHRFIEIHSTCINLALVVQTLDRTVWDLKDKEGTEVLLLFAIAQHSHSLR